MIPPADTRADILKVIAFHAGCAPDQLSDDDTLRDDLGIRNIELLDLSMDIEDAAQRIVPCNEMHAWETVADVVRWVEGRVA